MRRDFILEALVDFPDDALSAPCPLTGVHIDNLMKLLASHGIKRVIWGYYGDGHGGFLMPGIENGPDLLYDMNQYGYYAKTIEILENPLQVATEAAHRCGMEIYAYFKPYETGVSVDFPEGSIQARLWGRLYRIGGYLSWIDPFVVKNPHLRIKRRTDDLWYGIENEVITTIKLTKKDDSPTRIRKENIEIWTSNLNYKYRKKDIDFSFKEVIEPSKKDVYDVYGNLVTRKGQPVRILFLSNFALTNKYILITTNFQSTDADFAHTWDCLFTAYNEKGVEIPGVYATGTAIWFPEWENFRNCGVSFDTGRGPELIYLDLPNNPQDDQIRVEGAKKFHLKGQSKAQGFIAFSRGRNLYLPGGLCETEPAVQEYWLRCIGEMIDAGVDGVEFRVENHSCHTDTPQDYGFNDIVLEKIDVHNDTLAEITRVRTQAYSAFLKKASHLIRTNGKKVRINLNVDWFRDPSQRPGRRKLAFPANIDFEWENWIDQHIMDQAVLRIFAKDFSGIFGKDDVASKMIEKCYQNKIPLTVSRYVWNNDGLMDEFIKVYENEKFNGFILYETWSFIEFEKNGNCRISFPEMMPVVNMPDQLWNAKSNTGKNVKKILTYFNNTL
ncbi:MAG TPA: hypothetical protein PK165_01620 [bacterium]|nr:hypothetical protein [bacterium]HOL49237.1 hypothetical protein [bacterium]HPO51513.1 hypothetical protein [bacterium]